MPSPSPEPLTDTPSSPWRSPLLRGLAFAITASVCFSGKGIIAKLAYRYPGVDAIVVLALRMLFTLPMMLLLSWWVSRKAQPLPRKDLGRIVFIAFVGYYIASYTDFLGLQYISASLERLIYYLNPTLVLLLGWLFWRQRITRRQVLAMGLSYLGVVLVFWQEVQLAQQRHALLGAALVFTSALCYAFYLVVSGKLVQRVGALRLAGLATSISAGFVLLQFVLTRPLSALLVPMPVIGLSVINSVFCTVIPIVLTMMAVERIGPRMASQASMVGPLSTIGLSIALLGEPFTPWLVAGTLLVLLGISVTTSAHAQAARAGAAPR